MTHLLLHANGLALPGFREVVAADDHVEDDAVEGEGAVAVASADDYIGCDEGAAAEVLSGVLEGDGVGIALVAYLETINNAGRGRSRQ
mmetsp:Transcript_18198/g.33117  ORF Transcript_18198/g.33117 Transcript_18198/m.33117 type:complete len:88 (+) Transcript_18198:1999-2262(+)